ncbi:MAG: GHKL domain-containing protein [Firmicutes bacterium]|nr:GHKL domain-containing protein [Bacillota bacterium]
MIVPMTLIFIIALLYVMAAGFRFINALEEENRMLRTALEVSRVYSRTLAGRTEEIRRFRHDAAGLLQAMEAGPGSARKQDPLQDMPLLSSILELKARRCEEAGIRSRFDLQITDPKHLPPEEDLCLVLQNLLDNAIEASLCIEKTEERQVNLQMNQTGGMLTVTISNRMDGRQPVTFRTRKEGPGHGLGLRIVDDILRRRGGSRTVHFDRQERLVTMHVQMG